LLGEETGWAQGQALFSQVSFLWDQGLI